MHFHYSVLNLAFACFTLETFQKIKFPSRQHRSRTHQDVRDEEGIRRYSYVQREVRFKSYYTKTLSPPFLNLWLKKPGETKGPANSQYPGKELE